MTLQLIAAALFIGLVCALGWAFWLRERNDELRHDLESVKKFATVTSRYWGKS